MRYFNTSVRLLAKCTLHRWLPLAILMLTLLPTPAHAYDFMVDGIAYGIKSFTDEDEVEVTYTALFSSSNYAGLTTADIPNAVRYNGKTYSVTSIDSHAFDHCTTLTTVFIGNNVTEIEYSAFEDCSALAYVDIPNSVATIGQDAFNGCGSLDYIYIPSSVTSIGTRAFEDCKLSSITIPNSVNWIGSSAFDGTEWYKNQPDGLVYAGLVAYKYKGSMPANTAITIQNGTKGIACACFRYCKNLVSVSIPGTVETIGYYAFEDCEGLTCVTIPNLVTIIESGTFENCSNLSSVQLPSSITSIESHAFEDCTSLISITIPGSVESLGMQAFEGCTALTSITIPSSVTTIDTQAFWRCSGLETIKVDAGNPKYDSRDNCNALIETSTNKLVTGCKNTIIPNTVTKIQYYAFYDCIGLTSLTIPSSVTSIDTDAFTGCAGLSSIKVASANTVYDSRNNCNAIIRTFDNTLITGCKNTYIPNTVTAIGMSAFEGCSGLTSLTIPNSVTLIGRYAFQSCNGLTSVTIPSSVTVIDNYVFSHCDNLINLYSKLVDFSQLSMESEVFYACPSSTCVLKVPMGTVGAYRQADQWNTFTNIQEVFYKSETDGDLNCDNVVNGTDVNYLVNQLLKKNVYEDVDGATDINGDGRTSGLDLNRMISIILGH